MRKLFLTLALWAGLWASQPAASQLMHPRIDGVPDDSENLAIAGWHHLSILLRDAALVGYSVSNGGSGMPMERLALGYERIEWTYYTITATRAAGPPVTARWDVDKNVFR